MASESNVIQYNGMTQVASPYKIFLIVEHTFRSEVLNLCLRCTAKIFFILGIPP